MTAAVVSLHSRRRSQEPACGCPRHRLEALVAHALAELARSEGELLIPLPTLAALVDDLTELSRPH